MLDGRESDRFAGLIEVFTTVDEVLDGPQPLPPRLDRALWLVPGVREATMRRLVKSGFTDIAGLASHPRFGARAKKVKRLLDRSNPARLTDLIGSRAGRGNLLNLSLAGLFEASKILFLDIETMGLFGGSPIIQAGLAWIKGSRIVVRQLVARTPDAEAGLVREACDAIESCHALVTFNGRSFDFPYICQRAAYYGAPLSADPVHFDLLPYSRRVWRGQTTNCRLSTLAREVLGMKRDEDVDGSMVPGFYRDYLEDPDGRYGLLAGIVSHNRDDMIEMVRLYERLLMEARRLDV
ncbi:MAG: exonuclease [Deltaproteobacteria bacterium]|nr:exonuclease [Deltaproteobacteria bacterium]